MPNSNPMILTPEYLRQFPFYENHNVPGLLVQLDEDILFPVGTSNLEYIIENKLKVLLRPLSQLEEQFDMLEHIPSELKNELSQLCINKDFSILSDDTRTILIKNLFDVDCLIEEGIALPYQFEWKKDLESFWIID